MYRMITSTPILSYIYAKDTCARLIVKYMNIYVDLCMRNRYTMHCINYEEDGKCTEG